MDENENLNEPQQKLSLDPLAFKRGSSTVNVDKVKELYNF